MEQIKFSRELQVQADLRANEPIKDLPALMRVAVADAGRLDRSQYHASAFMWHRSRDNQPCNVCLAGSVMAGTLNQDNVETVYPCELPDNTSKAMYALNDMRRGLYKEAFEYLELEAPQGVDKIPVPSDKVKNFFGWARFDMLLDFMLDVADRLDDMMGVEKSDFDVLEFIEETVDVLA